MRPRQARMRFALCLGCATVLAGGFNSELTAQKLQLRHQARLDTPTRFSIQNGALNVRQKIGLIVGSRLTVTFNPRFSLATAVNYMPGYAEVRGIGKRFEVATGAHLFTASIGAQYWVLPPTRVFSWALHAGVGLAAGGQRAYQELFDGSTLSGTLATTLRYQIGRIVTLQLRMQDRLYRVRFGDGELGSSKPFRISLGLDFPFLDLVHSSNPQTPATVEPGTVR
jgi:hypothetical protein